MKFLRIVLIACLVFPANVLAMEEAGTQLSLSTSEISQELVEIWDLLNHQDFESAFVRQDRLLQHVTDTQITQDISYADFLAIIQNYSWQRDMSDRKKDLIHTRLQFHPEERRKCALVTRLSGYSTSCLMPWSKGDFVDWVDYLVRLVYRENQRNTERYIASLQQRVRSNQDKSDLGNILTLYISYYPNREKYFSPIIRNFGNQIIAEDPYWVNGYFLASQWLKPWSIEVLKLCDNLLKNYRGDENRKKIEIDSFTKRMCQK